MVTCYGSQWDDFLEDKTDRLSEISTTSIGSNFSNYSIVSSPCHSTTSNESKRSRTSVKTKSEILPTNIGLTIRISKV